MDQVKVYSVSEAQFEGIYKTPFYDGVNMCDILLLYLSIIFVLQCHQWVVLEMVLFFRMAAALCGECTCHVAFLCVCYIMGISRSIDEISYLRHKRGGSNDEPTGIVCCFISREDI